MGQGAEGFEFWYTNAMLQFSFYNRLIYLVSVSQYKVYLKEYEKQDVTKDIPRCHVLLIVIAIDTLLIYSFLKMRKWARCV